MLKTKISNFKISDNKEIYLLILSLVVGLCWWLTQAIAYSPDSTTYVILSQALVGNSGYFNSYVFMRTVGYPFLMILAGLPYTDSFTVLLLFQFAMAIYMPILFYRSVNLVVSNSKFAFNCSLFLVLSLLPFIYSKAIMTEHFFMFMIFYVSYRLILFYQSEAKKDLVHLGVSLTILTLIRPSANLFLILIFLHSSVFIGKHTRTWLKGLSVFFVMMIGLSASFSLNPIALPHIRGGIHQIVNQSLFYHLYLKGFYNDNEEIDHKSYTYQLKSLVEQYAKKTGTSHANLTPEYLYSALHSDKGLFVKKVFAEPNMSYYRYVKSALEATLASDQYKYPDDMSHSISKFMLSVSYETIKRHPQYLISYLKTYFLGTGSSFAGQMLFYHSSVPMPSLMENGKITDFYPLSGEHNNKLHQALKTYVYAYPQNWENREPAQSFTKYKGDPEGFLKHSIVERPSFPTIWFMWGAMDIMYSPPEVPTIFMKAATENLWKNKEAAVLMYLNNILYFTFGPSSCYYHGTQKISLLSPESPGGEEPVLRLNPRYARMKKEIDSGSFIKLSEKTSAQFFYIESIKWTIIKIMVTLIIMCGFILTFKTKQYKITTILLLMWLTHIFVSSVFGEPISRYVFQIMPLTLLLSSIALFDIASLYSKQNAKTLLQQT